MLLTNARLATMQFGLIDQGAIAIENNHIAWLGAEVDLPKRYRALTTEDVDGRLVTPGLIDCHTHLVYAGHRAHEFLQRLQGATYAEIAQAGGGIQSTVQSTRAATPEQLFTQSATRLKTMLDQGVTTVEIKSGYGLDLANERKILQVAAALAQQFSVNIQKTFLGAHALPAEFARRADDYIDYIIHTMMPTLAAENLIDAVDCFCEKIGFTYAQSERILQAAKALGLPVKLHAEQLSDQNGASLAARYQALSADHLEYISESAVQAMAAAGTVAVLLPGAFYFLRETKAPPIDWFRRYKVPMALATDCNPGSSPTCSLQLMLNFACTLWDFTPAEALQGVTCHAARALGLAQTHGTLAVGKVADIAVWNCASIAELVYYFGTNLCARRFKAGV